MTALLHEWQHREIIATVKAEAVIDKPLDVLEALNIASGAVLVLSIFAALIGSLILGWAAVEWFYGFGGGQVLSS